MLGQTEFTLQWSTPEPCQTKVRLSCSKTNVFLDEETLLCPDCQAKSKRAPLSRVIAGSAYTGLAPHLISKFKYGGARYMADPLTDIIMAHPEFNVLAPYIYAIVPVPMHWAKRLIRGYNQAEDLAYELSSRSKRTTSWPCSKEP